jgi:hypothetical protein
MSALKLIGEVVSIGDMPADEVPQIAGVPHVLLAMAGGGTLLISGMTREECATLGRAFARIVTVSFEVSA